MTRYLVIGASGFLGSQIYQQLLDFDRDVIGTFFKNKRKGLQHLDLKNQSIIESVLESSEPDIIIHAGGLTDTNFCEFNQEKAHQINVLGTRKLLDSFEGKFVYISTDYVFDGLKGSYDEGGLPNPLNYYGETKRLAEKFVLEGKKNLVMRTSGLYGCAKNNKKSITQYQKNQEVVSYVDLFSTPTFINDFRSYLEPLLEQEGIVHFSGYEKFSRYEFSKKLSDELNLGLNVIPMTYPQNPKVKRPRDSSLITTKLNFNMTSLEDALKQIRSEMYANN